MTVSRSMYCHGCFHTTTYVFVENTPDGARFKCMCGRKVIIKGLVVDKEVERGKSTA